MSVYRSFYLAGPMSGHVDHNYPAFDAAVAELRSVGISVVSPHERHPAGLPPFIYWEWADFLRNDLIVLLSECDGVVYLPGSELSRGASLEMSVAEALDYPVLSLAEALSGVLS